MSDAPDYYAILQVDPRAEPEVIDAAYRRLAAKYHPDVNGAPDAAEQMKQINAAYDVLSDPRRRAAYDAGRGRPASGAPLDLRRVIRSLLLPAGVLLFALLASRVGVKAALLIVIALALIVYYWLFEKRGSGG